MSEDEHSTNDTNDNKSGSSPAGAPRSNDIEYPPFFEEYARKIVGEDAELPKDYPTLVMEARMRGRAGLPQPHLKPHRCENHLQDFIESIFNEGTWETAKLYFRCVGSKQGEEPERYKFKNGPNP